MTENRRSEKMIDTIILSLPQGSYTISDHDKFTPSTKDMCYQNFGGQSFIKYVQNPTTSDYKNGNYKPRLTITKRIVTGGIATPLKIEFSAPKLLFGNNFDELTDSDFPRIIDMLLVKLKEMGVGVFRHQLEQARVPVVHYSKNIILTDYSTASMVIRELGKVDLTKRLDLNKTHFRNEGHALYYYAKSFSLVFYDKIKDLAMPSGRAVEQDNQIQLNLFDTLKTETPMEVLRMELRLCDARKIKSIFKTLNIPEDLTFQAIFSQETSKKVLKHYWQEVLGNLELLKFSTVQPIDLLELLMKNNQGFNLKTLFSYFGVLILTNSVGPRVLREAIKGRYSDRTWQRFRKSLYNIRNPPEGKYQSINAIGKVLDQFETIKLKDFKID